MSAYVKEIYYYPLKGGAARALDHALIGPAGIEGDRAMTLVHDGGAKHDRVLTQRDKGCEKLALVTVAPAHGGRFDITMPGVGHRTRTISIRHNDYNDAIRSTVDVWGDAVGALDAGDDAAAEFSAYLDTPCRLKLMPAGELRAMRGANASGSFVNYADGAALHLTNDTSLTALARHFTHAADIAMTRFRPNIVVAGLDPFAEDVIGRIGIGRAVLDVAKPCERCAVTVVDQARGQRAGKEPLATLGRLRRGDDGQGVRGAFFGVDVAVREAGAISVGDRVEILSLRAPHPALADVRLGYGINP